MKLVYRKIDYETDLPEITSLIQKNLDQNFTLDFLKWKHLENPFGRSFGLVAVHKDKIVGLRLFMFWNFVKTDAEIVTAVRPVDTVTANEYRGMGIFKTLTLTGLKECSKNFRFIFNTPNSNSFTGYIKMGWLKLENLPHFKLGILNFSRLKGEIQEVEVKDLHFNPEYNLSTVFSTYKTNEFLIWRYSHKHYKTIIWEEDFSTFIIYKVIRVNFFRCIIIYEIFGKKNILDKMLHSLGKKLNIFLVYYLNVKEFEYINFIKTFKRGQPVIVFKGNLIDYAESLNFSLGDLEGKL